MYIKLSFHQYQLSISFSETKSSHFDEDIPHSPHTDRLPHRGMDYQILVRNNKMFDYLYVLVRYSEKWRMNSTAPPRLILEFPPNAYQFQTKVMGFEIFIIKVKILKGTSPRLKYLLPLLIKVST